MMGNPYYSSINPAAFTPYKGYFSIPCIGNLNVEFTNTAFRYHKLFKTDKEGYPTAITINQFVESLHQKQNWLNLSVNEEILGFGFRIKFLFFAFSYRMKMDGYFQFSKDLFGLPILGNMNYVENPADIDLNLNANVYQEFSLSVQAQIGKRLYLGVRPKFLLGIANLKTTALNAQIFTDPDTYDISMKYEADMAATLAFPNLRIDENGKPVVDFDVQDWRNLLKNKGFAFDAGAIFRLNDHWGVGASINDIGFINWETSGIRYTSQYAGNEQLLKDGNFYFSGLTMEQLTELMDNSNEFFQKLTDSLKSYFPLTGENFIQGTQWLNGRFTAHAYFEWTKMLRITTLFQGTFVGKKSFIPKFTIAYSGRFGRILDLCAHYNIAPSNYANFGVGLGLGLGPIYLYLATDNLFAFIRYKDARSLNAQFGLSFRFGRGIEKTIQKKKNQTDEYTPTEKQEN
jgi:hypothetical protein